MTSQNTLSDLQNRGDACTSSVNLGPIRVGHARMFFERPDFDLASAKPGTFAIKTNPNMLDSLRRDYANTVSMIFGAAPTFEEIMASIDEIEAAANRVP